LPTFAAPEALFFFPDRIDDDESASETAPYNRANGLAHVMLYLYSISEATQKRERDA
jgi:hypothetical protein